MYVYPRDIKTNNGMHTQSFIDLLANVCIKGLTGKRKSVVKSCQMRMSGWKPCTVQRTEITVWCVCRSYLRLALYIFMIAKLWNITVSRWYCSVQWKIVAVCKPLCKHALNLCQIVVIMSSNRNYWMDLEGYVTGYRIPAFQKYLGKNQDVFQSVVKDFQTPPWNIVIYRKRSSYYM